MKIVICDIDGTIADISHRLKYLESKPKDWDKFYSLVSNDAVYDDMRELVSILSQHYEIVYVSGRREETRANTLTWLDSHGFPDGKLYMRKDGDMRSDTEVKQHIYDWYLQPLEIAFCLDDRDSVVKFWRKLGLRCLQVKNGDY